MSEKEKAEKKQTVTLQKKKEHKGSVKYECAEKAGLALDNVYIYKDSVILKDGIFPDEITVTVRAGGKAE